MWPWAICWSLMSGCSLFLSASSAAEARVGDGGFSARRLQAEAVSPLVQFCLDCTLLVARGVLRPGPLPDRSEGLSRLLEQTVRDVSARLTGVWGCLCSGVCLGFYL